MTKTELVFVPTSAMGHLLSTVEFAKLIVRTNPNISILVLIYHSVFHEFTKIQSYIDSQSLELDPTQITFITLPPLSNPPDPSDPAFFGTIVELQNPLVKKAAQDRQSKPAAFILDIMNVSMIDIANELHIPSYIFFTAGANLLHTMLHFQRIADDQGTDDIIGLMGDPDNELELPGFRNRVPTKVWPWVFLNKDSIWPSLILNLARRFREAKGILVNSFFELESSIIQALQNQVNIPTIYPVGPILSLQNRGDSKPSNNNDISSLKMSDEESIISWLDGQPKSSVVFLCFGSMGCFDAEQVKEIAEGLDRSGHRFLWSLRKPVQVGTFGALPSEHVIFDEALPEGFIDRTANRGKIIPWAPQVAVLAHQAIGGFVSHCGWNSILESIWFGVPLATWPMYSEQQLNAFTLVKELGLAVEIKIDYRWDMKKSKGNYLVKAEEVEDGVRKLMNLDDEMKGKVREMSELSRKVLQTDNGANLLHAMLHFQGVVDELGTDDIIGLMGGPDNEVELPGFRNPLPTKLLPWMYLEKDSVWPSLILNLARRFRQAKGILVNTFMELESFTIQALQNQDNIPTIYPVGPILSLQNRGDSKPSNNNDDISSLKMSDEESIISWLDGQPKSSVVFLCFGSMGCFDAEQVKEIAEGLDRSGHRFLWSLRKPIQVGTFGGLPSEHMIFDEALPDGFIDRTAHRGKIIPWAPQVAVLAHQAIGGFVSHCGWNSTLESIWFGVPLATWPMYAEQQLNAFTLVKELGLAVEIKIDYRWDMKKSKGNYLVKAEEVEDGVRKLMNLDDEMKRKVHELTRTVLQTNDGSSRAWLTRFIAEINENSD